MFSRGEKSSSKGTSTVPQDDTIASSSAPATVRKPQPAAMPAVPSIISSDLTIVGNLKSEGDLQIDGTVEGDVTSRAVTIGEGAVVHGTLTGDSARIYGALVGHIKVGSVMLAKTAKVEADIHHVSLAVESGASIIGSLRRLDSATKAEPGETAAPESIAVGDVRREA